MTWNSSPLQVNCRAEISSPSALAQWTEHRKACTETAPRFFSAAVAACFIVQRSGLRRAGSARWPNVRLWEVAGSRSHLWPILAGSRELGSNPLDKKRAFLRSDRFGVSIRGDSSRNNRQCGSDSVLSRLPVTRKQSSKGRPRSAFKNHGSNVRLTGLLRSCEGRRDDVLGYQDGLPAEEFLRFAIRAAIVADDHIEFGKHHH